jgi:hypothetical protein
MKDERQEWVTLSSESPSESRSYKLSEIARNGFAAGCEAWALPRRMLID